MSLPTPLGPLTAALLSQAQGAGGAVCFKAHVSPRPLWILAVQKFLTHGFRLFFFSLSLSLSCAASVVVAVVLACSACHICCRYVLFVSVVVSAVVVLLVPVFLRLSFLLSLLCPPSLTNALPLLRAGVD